MKPWKEYKRCDLHNFVTSSSIFKKLQEVGTEIKYNEEFCTVVFPFGGFSLCAW
jgi:hypothetical protein